MSAFPSEFLVEAVGFVGGASTTMAFVPQVIKTYRTRSADDLSLIMYLVFTLGVTCWLLYGLGIGSMPVIAANAATLLLVLSVLFMKIIYTRGRAARAER
jgi:MtN3 and saliva related transmembrane protein